MVWDGSDGAGAGIAGYDLEVSQDDGASRTRLLTTTQSTSFPFPGQFSHRYTFRARATDNVSHTTSSEAEASIVQVTKYYHFGGQRIAMRQGGMVYYLHGDHPSASLRTGLGSTSVASSDSGALFSRQGYYPYGEVRYASGELPTEFGFTGQRNDSYIKLYQMGARWYNPYLNRWISPDALCPASTNDSQFSLALTVSYAETSILTRLNDINRQGSMKSVSTELRVPGNPQLCNRFSYVVNNPLGFTDPSGHDPIPPWRRWASKVCGALAATFDTLAWDVSLAGVALEGAGLVGVPVTVGEEPLTFLGAMVLYNFCFNPIENILSYGAFGFTAAGDWLSGANYIKLNPLTVGIGQDTAVSYAAIVVGSGMPLTPEAFTDFLANTAVVVYDYGRLLELIPTSFEIRIIGVTEDGLDILKIVPLAGE